MRFRTGFVSLSSAAMLIAAPLAIAHAEEKAAEKAPAKPSAPHTIVEKGSKVAVEYTLSLPGGEVVESNAGKEPLTYEQGAGTMLPAFEAQVDGLKSGATKEFDLAPEQAYGPVRKELYQTVDAKQIPPEAHKVGTRLMAKAESGQQRPVRVHEINGDKIVLDLNHPLAGKKLHFAVKIVSVE